MKIAVIGAGVSGMGAALALSERHDVRLFEKEARFGGHAHTVEIDHCGARIAVDTGFIVFNEVNYPNLCAFFDHLGVASDQSNMSFGVSLDGGRMEYGVANLDTVFAQRRRALDPRFWRSFAEIRRFHREAKTALANGSLDDGTTLAAFLDGGGYSQYVRENFLYAMGGAIWSTSTAAMADFPARAFMQFFENHALLRGFEHVIAWRTVRGGSREYVDRAIRALGPRAVAGVGAVDVRRLDGGGVAVRLEDGSVESFDQVVMATHSDVTLGLLSDADAEERALLGAVRYAPNMAYLHRDPNLMPKRRKVWSSWCFLSETGSEARPPAVSYWMNRLQNIESPEPVIVTLNPPEPPAPELTYLAREWAHPQFDRAAFKAQSGFDRVQGRGGVWHAGAWLGWGFHEDGLRAGLRVATALGARPSWAKDVGAPSPSVEEQVALRLAAE